MARKWSLKSINQSKSRKNIQILLGILMDIQRYRQGTTCIYNLKNKENVR
jgi:hypothetical protein